MTIGNGVYKNIFTKVDDTIKKYEGTRAVSEMRLALAFSYDIIPNKTKSEETIDNLAETFNKCNSAEEVYSVGRAITNVVTHEYCDELIPIMAKTFKKYAGSKEIFTITDDFNKSSLDFEPDQTLDVATKWF